MNKEYTALIWLRYQDESWQMTDKLTCIPDKEETGFAMASHELSVIL